MAKEHIRSSDSSTEFCTSNYAITTTSEAEWWFVNDPSHGLDLLGLSSFPAEREGTPHMRVATPPSRFSEVLQLKNAELAAENEPTLLNSEFVGEHSLAFTCERRSCAHPVLMCSQRVCACAPPPSSTTCHLAAARRLPPVYPARLPCCA